MMTAAVLIAARRRLPARRSARAKECNAILDEHCRDMKTAIREERQVDRALTYHYLYLRQGARCANVAGFFVPCGSICTQQAARADYAGGGGSHVPTWGEQFTRHDGLKAFAEETTRPGRFRIEMQTTLTNDPASGGSLGVPTRDATVMMPRRRMAVRDLLPVVSVSSNAVEYPAQTGRTNNAATVAEGAVKPESGLAFELRTLPTQVIAHWIPANSSTAMAAAVISMGWCLTPRPSPRRSR
jgi:HK97 family phage major capsid protein